MLALYLVLFSGNVAHNKINLQYLKLQVVYPNFTIAVYALSRSTYFCKISAIYIQKIC